MTTAIVAEPKKEVATPASLFERLAMDPNVDVDKLERLMAMHERAVARSSEDAFNAAMSTAQSEMRPVAADCENPQTRSRYASHGALDVALRPIYTRHGFGLSYNTTESPVAEHIRVLCYVTHRDGGARTYHVDMPADGKGAKGGDVMTKTHAAGAAMSYGMRYLLKMIFSVAVGEFDTDGNAPQAKNKPPAPRGYDEWLLDMTSAADSGLDALDTAWQATKGEFKAYATKYDNANWNAVKTRAANADRAKGGRR